MHENDTLLRRICTEICTVTFRMHISRLALLSMKKCYNNKQELLFLASMLKKYHEYGDYMNYFNIKIVLDT